MSKTVSLKAARAATKELPINEAMLPIKALCQLYSEEFSLLAAQSNALEVEIDLSTERHMPAIMQTVDRVKKLHIELNDLLKQNPQAFEKPRTTVFHGIKVGFNKLIGKLTFKDEEKAVALIQKHFPEQFDSLVETKYVLRKAAAAALPAADLLKIGGAVKDGDDQIVIKYAASDVSKLIKTLLEDGLK